MRNIYTVSIVTSIVAETEKEALEEVQNEVKDCYFNESTSFDVEIEEENYDE